MLLRPLKRLNELHYIKTVTARFSTWTAWKDFSEKHKMAEARMMYDKTSGTVSEPFKLELQPKELWEKITMEPAEEEVEPDEESEEVQKVLRHIVANPQKPHLGLIRDNILKLSHSQHGSLVINYALSSYTASHRSFLIKSIINQAYPIIFKATGRSVITEVLTKYATPPQVSQVATLLHSIHTDTVYDFAYYNLITSMLPKLVSSDPEKKHIVESILQHVEGYPKKQAVSAGLMALCTFLTDHLFSDFEASGKYIDRLERYLVGVWTPRHHAMNEWMAVMVKQRERLRMKGVGTSWGSPMVSKVVGDWERMTTKGVSKVIWFELVRSLHPDSRFLIVYGVCKDMEDMMKDENGNILVKILILYADEEQQSMLVEAIYEPAKFKESKLKFSKSEEVEALSAFQRLCLHEYAINCVITLFKFPPVDNDTVKAMSSEISAIRSRLMETTKGAYLTTLAAAME